MESGSLAGAVETILMWSPMGKVRAVPVVRVDPMGQENKASTLLPHTKEPMVVMEIILAVALAASAPLLERLPLMLVG